MQKNFRQLTELLFPGVVSHVQALAQGDEAAGWSGADGQKEAEKPSQDSLQALATKIMESTLKAHSATPLGPELMTYSLCNIFCFEI